MKASGNLLCVGDPKPEFSDSLGEVGWGEVGAVLGLQPCVCIWLIHVDIRQKRHNIAILRLNIHFSKTDRVQRPQANKPEIVLMLESDASG